MSRARRGDGPSVDAVRDRFEAWAADRVARLLIQAGISDFDPATLRVRPVDGMHEWSVATKSSGRVVVGRIPILEFANAHGDIAEDYVRELALKVQLRRGRPPGLTTIPNDDPLRAAIVAMDREGRRVTRASLAARAGFTEDELRGYLEVTGRSAATLYAELRRT